MRVICERTSGKPWFRRAQDEYAYPCSGEQRGVRFNGEIILRCRKHTNQFRHEPHRLVTGEELIREVIARTLSEAT